MKVLVIGAGGHGCVVADILRASAKAGSDFEFIGFLDDAPRYLDPAVRGPLGMLPLIEHDAVIVAIGDNETRSHISRHLAASGERLVTVSHPSAILTGGVSIDDGSMICAGAIAGVGTTLGRGVILNTACSVDHHCRIADYVHIAPGVRVGGEVAIGVRALVGIGAVILPRVTIGHDAIVGAGAVVTRDVAPHTTVVGTPAAPMVRRHLTLVASGTSR